jgi:membrane fusion protein (multidrug efflux system)
MAEVQSTSNQKKKKAFMIVGTVVAIGLISGWFYNNYRKTHISTDDAFIDGDIYTISARIDGTVSSVYVDSNQPVKKGDLLVELDPRDYRSRFEAAQAHLALEQANLRQADRDLKRIKALFDQDVNSAERYDKALSTQEISAAQVKVAVEQLRQAELNLSYTEIKAPADGYVTKKNVMVGNQVKTGQPLMALVNLDALKVIANYKETQLERIRPGQPAEIKVDAYPGMVFKGKVDSIMAGTGVSFSLFPPENATGNYVKVVQRVPVKIVLDPGADKEHLLKIGMSVVPTIMAK